MHLSLLPYPSCWYQLRFVFNYFLSVAQNSKTHIRLLRILILHISLAHYISSDNRDLLYKR